MTNSLDPAWLRDLPRPTRRQERAASTVQQDVRVLAATIDLAPVGIAHLDRDGRFRYVNDRMCAILGYPEEELLEHEVQEFTFPDDPPGAVALADWLASGARASYNQDKRLIRRDGSDMWARVTVSAVRLARDEIDFFLVIAEDISAQRASDAARREAEERLRLALDASATGTFRWDVRTRAFEWDENLERLFGLAPGAARSDADFMARVHPDDRRRLLEAWWLSAGEGAELEEEFRVVRPDGSIRWLRDRGRTMPDADGTPCCLAGACTDVTERRHAEDERRAQEIERERLLALERTARAEAERAIRMRDEVLGVVAHDLRNPVHTISMAATLMLDVPMAEDQRANKLQIIRRTAKEMNRLISDLLDVTRIESGSFTLVKAPVAVAPLFGQMLELFAPQARERGIEILIDIEPEMPLVMADHDRLGQVLSNLVGNSLKFTEAGGRITIRASHRRGEGAGWISVEDTGCGIPAEYLPHVFDRFWQANRASRAGAGLGLAIARGIIAAHGGEIWVQSTVGVGTTFYFTLDLAGR